MLVKIMLSLFWLIIIPYVIGKFLVKKEDNKILYTWIIGHMLQMGVFFIIAIPMILLRMKFTTLLYTYSIVLIILAILSLIINRKKFIYKIDIKNIEWKSLFKKISIYQLIFFVIIGTQLFVRYKYTSINDDDSSFITISTSMIDTDKMYLTSSEGNSIEKLSARKALAPINAYFAVVSQQVDINVTILSHTIMPIILILIAYILYYYFAKTIFTNPNSIFIFLIFVSLLNLYAFDMKGYNRYLLLYTWFGRAILAAIILPFIWKISFDAMNKEKNKLIDWLNIFILVNAGCLCSEMAVPLISTSVGAITLINSIRDKKISYILKSLLCVSPCIIIGCIYLNIM